MNLPKNIKNLTELKEWIKENKPVAIVIKADCKIVKIAEFATKEHKTFDGIPVWYLWKSEFIRTRKIKLSKKKAEKIFGVVLKGRKFSITQYLVDPEAKGSRAVQIVFND